ncbi:hypothetical protein [Actinoplanes aureus]|jgi:hypothetical protein|uniref:Uncharacterized protein n=1 Tax=Actinoplanes aureus TaxID=2792083 RepID=A0A931CNF8_9ACTN|nr:hypothetical protein [Actinoplanes aureus]MBG0568105.1 hypothetical protein [Actinoplanes aureus]
MSPFTSPEFQLELIRSHTDDLIRQADHDRRARQSAEGRHRRTARWPRIRRAATPARRLAS